MLGVWKSMTKLLHVRSRQYDRLHAHLLALAQGMRICKGMIKQAKARYDAHRANLEREEAAYKEKHDSAKERKRVAKEALDQVHGTKRANCAF